MKYKYQYRQEYYADLPHGEQMEKGILRAIAAAKEEGEFQAALALYDEFFDECVFYDDVYDALLLLPEYTAVFEAHPECQTAAAHDLMWAYKWCSNDYQDFYQISMEQIEAMLHRYASLCDRFGYNKKTYYRAICDILADTNPDGTLCGLTFAGSRRMMSRLGRDELSDCRACELHDEIEYALFADNDYQRAVRLARPLFVGSLSCAEVPHTTYALFASYCLQTGRFMDAEEYADKSWRLINRKYSTTPSLAYYEGDLLLSYAYTNRRKGLAVFKKTFPYCWNIKNGLFSWKYYYGAYHLLSEMAKAGSRKITMRFPDRAADIEDGDGKCDVREIRDYLYNKLSFLTDKFDERNGNTLFRDRLSLSFAAAEEGGGEEEGV